MILLLRPREDGAAAAAAGWRPGETTAGSGATAGKRHGCKEAAWLSGGNAAASSGIGDRWSSSVRRAPPPRAASIAD